MEPEHPATDLVLSLLQDDDGVALIDTPEIDRGVSFLVSFMVHLELQKARTEEDVMTLMRTPDFVVGPGLAWDFKWLLSYQSEVRNVLLRYIYYVVSCYENAFSESRNLLPAPCSPILLLAAGILEDTYLNPYNTPANVSSLRKLDALYKAGGAQYAPRGSFWRDLKEVPFPRAHSECLRTMCFQLPMVLFGCIYMPIPSESNQSRDEKNLVWATVLLNHLVSSLPELYPEPLDLLMLTTGPTVRSCPKVCKSILALILNAAIQRGARTKPLNAEAYFAQIKHAVYLVSLVLQVDFEHNGELASNSRSLNVSCLRALLLCFLGTNTAPPIFRLSQWSYQQLYNTAFELIGAYVHLSPELSAVIETVSKALGKSNVAPTKQ